MHTITSSAWKRLYERVELERKQFSYLLLGCCLRELTGPTGRIVPDSTKMVLGQTGTGLASRFLVDMVSNLFSSIKSFLFKHHPQLRVRSFSSLRLLIPRPTPTDHSSPKDDVEEPYTSGSCCSFSRFHHPLPSGCVSISRQGLASPDWRTTARS